MQNIKKYYDVIVVGGGIAGVCAALSSARRGVKTALIQNRSVLGGNASSEIKVNINGATQNGKVPDVSETGIMMELILANKAVNPQNSIDVFCMVLWEIVNKEPLLDLYLNTQFLNAKVDKGNITEITAFQFTSETMFTFSATIFVDTTGDANLAYESGAEWTIGREAKSTYGELHAPEIADEHTMGSTVMFTTKDMGKPTPFTRPEWAYEFTKEKLAGRAIKMTNHGYWWVELGGGDTKVIEDSENIRDDLFKWAFGVFDYIKNCGEYDADNLALDWICTLPGRRESRRILGDYVLNENDIATSHQFEDTIGYGGWTMDDHSVGGINAKGKNEQGTQWIAVPGIYTIPYRSLYSRNINNLYVGGRAMSASHMAITSTRIIATCGVLGQAIGTAAAIAIKENVSPREVGEKYIAKLQQQLITDDCYLPNIEYTNSKDMLKREDCVITASNYNENGKPDLIRNGLTRRINGDENAWIAPLNNEAWISAEIPNAQLISRIDLKFDPDLSISLQPTLTPKRFALQPKELPEVLVKTFKVEAFFKDECVWQFNCEKNIQRLHQIILNTPVLCDKVKLTVQKTYGDTMARVFEMRVYQE